MNESIRKYLSQNILLLVTDLNVLTSESLHENTFTTDGEEIVTVAEFQTQVRHALVKLILHVTKRERFTFLKISIGQLKKRLIIRFIDH